MFENADYEGASKIFTELSDYKDSVEMVKNCAIQPEYDKAIQLVKQISLESLSKT